MREEHIEMIQLGSMLFLAAYHIILFFQVKKNYYLFLGLLVFMVFVRALLVDDGSRLLYQTFPSMGPLTGRKIEYLAAYSALILMPLFIGNLYKFSRFKKFVRLFLWIGGILSIFVLVTPFAWYRQTLNIYHLAMVFAFVLVFFIVYRAIKRKKTGAKYVFYGIIIAFGFVFLEMLKNSRLVPYFDVDGPNLVNSGVLLFFFFQAVALAEIYAKSFRENEKLNRELEERVSNRTEQLSKSNLIKERFLKIVSHDLRAPMGNLKSMLVLLESDTITEKQSRKLIDKITVNLDGSLDLLDDLLEWTKATSESKLKIYKERMDLVKLIDETIPLFSEIANQKNIELKMLRKRNTPVFVESDINLVKVVLRNLIGNAIKFTEPGGSIEVGFKRKARIIEVFVSDDGIGIPEEMKESIFDMESKNKRTGTGNEKSTGVGLALCRDLIKQNGGKIWIEDNEPKGSTFKFNLDLAG